jgi:hypothetical protein
MKTIQFILFMVFISGASILMINSGRVSPQIEQQYNGYWTVIANTQSDHVSTFGFIETDHSLPPANNTATRSSGYYLGNGRVVNAVRNLPTMTEALSATTREPVQNSPLNPLHSRIIQATLQPMDLLISPEESAKYAATLDRKNQYGNKRE